MNHDEWEYAGLYYDEGISGTKKETRSALMQMLSSCKHGLVDYMVTKSISRLARNTTDCLEIVEKLCKSKGMFIVPAGEMECESYEEFIQYIEFRKKNYEVISTLDELDAFDFFKKNGNVKISIDADELMITDYIADFDKKYKDEDKRYLKIFLEDKNNPPGKYVLEGFFTNNSQKSIALSQWQCFIIEIVRR